MIERIPESPMWLLFVRMVDFYITMLFLLPKRLFLSFKEVRI